MTRTHLLGLVVLAVEVPVVALPDLGGVLLGPRVGLLVREHHVVFERLGVDPEELDVPRGRLLHVGVTHLGGGDLDGADDVVLDLLDQQLLVVVALEVVHRALVLLRPVAVALEVELPRVVLEATIGENRPLHLPRGDQEALLGGGLEQQLALDHLVEDLLLDALTVRLLLARRRAHAPPHGQVQLHVPDRRAVHLCHHLGAGGVQGSGPEEEDEHQAEQHDDGVVDQGAGVVPQVTEHEISVRRRACTTCMARARGGGK